MKLNELLHEVEVTEGKVKTCLYTKCSGTLLIWTSQLRLLIIICNV